MDGPASYRFAFHNQWTTAVDQGYQNGITAGSFEWGSPSLRPDEHDGLLTFEFDNGLHDGDIYSIDVASGLGIVFAGMAGENDAFPTTQGRNVVWKAIANPPSHLYVSSMIPNPDPHAAGFIQTTTTDIANACGNAPLANCADVFLPQIWGNWLTYHVTLNNGTIAQGIRDWSVAIQAPVTIAVGLGYPDMTGLDGGGLKVVVGNSNIDKQPILEMTCPNDAGHNCHVAPSWATALVLVPDTEPSGANDYCSYPSRPRVAGSRGQYIIYRATNCRIGGVMHAGVQLILTHERQDGSSKMYFIDDITTSNADTEPTQYDLDATVNGVMIMYTNTRGAVQYLRLDTAQLP